MSGAPDCSRPGAHAVDAGKGSVRTRGPGGLAEAEGSGGLLAAVGREPPEELSFRGGELGPSLRGARRVSGSGPVALAGLLVCVAPRVSAHVPV